MSVAHPSRSVPTTTRMPMSLARRTRRSSLASTGQLIDQAEDWQIHGDDDAADDAAEQRDHQRFEEREQARYRNVDLLLVEVRNLAEHRVERAGCLTDSDHLDDHRWKYFRLLQR